MVHYETLEDTHKANLSEVQQNIKETESTLSEDTAKDHKELLQKTTSTIEKKRNCSQKEQPRNWML